MEEKTLYERLGGAFAIAAVVDRFSDEIMKDAKVGKNSTNPYVRQFLDGSSQGPIRLV